jgi:hypothetical protein
VYNTAAALSKRITLEREIDGTIAGETLEATRGGLWASHRRGNGSSGRRPACVASASRFQVDRSGGCTHATILLPLTATPHLTVSLEVRFAHQLANLLVLPMRHLHQMAHHGRPGSAAVTLLG